MLCFPFLQNDVETFDTFLKYPKDIVYPKTIEEEIARLKKIKSKLEQEDRLPAEPFLDYIAYRLHPLHTRGETRRLFGIHPLKLQANTCALSDSGAMWCVRKASFVPLFREKREFDDFSAYLDSISGAREALHGTAEVDPEYMLIIQGKIDDVNRHLNELRSARLSQLDKAIKEEPMERDCETHSGEILCDELTKGPIKEEPVESNYATDPGEALYDELAHPGEVLYDELTEQPIKEEPVESNYETDPCEALYDELTHPGGILYDELTEQPIKEEPVESNYETHSGEALYDELKLKLESPFFGEVSSPIIWNQQLDNEGVLH
ncbi:unnamed protein product [Heligmosomoides polygyrus]|uniref:ING domain-containing protein n=1 Tax=Heligmosomoides polygyrus TaxID=6339 RepID=A0A3P8BV63_HELPZ|nr:unnamed protein product [Heligmosomoides polygyrus]